MLSVFQKSAPYSARRAACGAFVLPLFLGAGMLCAAENEAALAESEASLIQALKRVGTLKAQLETISAQKAALVEALAEANAEREVLPGTGLDEETLGVAALSDGTSGLERRLLAAVNDLRVAEGENRALRSHLRRLVDQAAAHLAGNPAAEPRVRSEVESAAAFLGSEWTPQDAIAQLTGPRPGEVSVREIEVVGVRPELGLVILGHGTSSGLRPGMPLVISHGGETIATATLIEARKGIAGAVLTSASPTDKAITVGDIAQLATTDSIISR